MAPTFRASTTDDAPSRKNGISDRRGRWRIVKSGCSAISSPRQRERQGSTGLVKYGLFEAFQPPGRPGWRAVVGVTLLDPSSHEGGWLDVLCGCLLADPIKKGLRQA